MHPNRLNKRMKIMQLLRKARDLGILLSNKSRLKSCLNFMLKLSKHQSHFNRDLKETKREMVRPTLITINSQSSGISI
jgi:hypothetical protein